MKKRKLRIPFKSLVIILISLFIFYFSLRSLFLVLDNSKLFNIKTVFVNSKNIDSSPLIGKNIFSINLAKEAQRILALHPNYHKVIVRRLLPSRIDVELKMRRPLAFIRLFKYFAVDEEAVIFNLNDKNAIDEHFPIILGLETKIINPQTGKSYRDVKELSLSLDLIKEKENIKGLMEFRIKKIDAAVLNSLSFYTSQDFEVKVGETNLSHKLRLLNSILAQRDLDLSHIKYIDLRFKEPVIKYKNEK